MSEEIQKIHMLVRWHLTTEDRALIGNGEDVYLFHDPNTNKFSLQIGDGGIKPNLMTAHAVASTNFTGVCGQETTCPRFPDCNTYPPCEPIRATKVACANHCAHDLEYMVGGVCIGRVQNDNTPGYHDCGHRCKPEPFRDSSPFPPRQVVQPEEAVHWFRGNDIFAYPCGARRLPTGTESRDPAGSTCQPCRQAAKTLNLLEERLAAGPEQWSGGSARVVDSSSIMPWKGAEIMTPIFNLSAGTTGCIECGAVWATPGPTFFSPRGILYTHIGHHIIIQRTDTDQRLARVRENLSLEYLSQREVDPERKAPQCAMRCDGPGPALGHVPAHQCILPDGHDPGHQFECGWQSPGRSRVLYGWIKPTNPNFPHISERELKLMGVKVGRWNEAEKQFDGCEVSPSAFTELDKHWSSGFIWGLEQPPPGRVLPSGEQEKCGNCGTETTCYYLSHYGKGAICQVCRDAEMLKLADEARDKL